MACQEDEFPAGDGVQLFERRWLPENDPEAVVLIVHGFTEHGGRYTEFAEELNRRGYAVACMDLRGHGRSPGPRAYVDHFEQYVDDLQTQVARTQKQWSGRPLFVFGHSMGGTIVLQWALRQPSGTRGIVLSAPALQVAAGLFPILRRLAGLVSRLMPRLKIVRLGFLRISRDPQVVTDFRDDPLVFHDRFPVRTGAEILRAVDEAQKNFSSLRLPLLLLQGTSDKIVDPRACRRLVSQAKSTDKELRLYEGFYHDLLHEIDRETVLQDIIAWLDARR